MTNYYTKDRPGPLERVISKLSVQTVALGSPGGGAPELTASDMAAAVAGLRDEVGQLLPDVFAEEAQAVDRTVQLLDAWGWMQWRVRWPAKAITGALHGRLAEAVVADYQLGGKGYAVRDICAHLQCSGARFAQLAPQWDLLFGRLLEAESALAAHLRRALRPAA